MQVQEIVKKVQCPKCAAEGRDEAEDNAHVFESGFANCIAGHGSLGKLDNVLVDYPAPYCGKSKSDDNIIQIRRENMSQFKTGEYADIKSRNISRKTCEYYGYMINRDDNCHIAQYYDAAGNVIMQQIRTADKQFPIIGDRSGNDQLWGSHLFSPNDNLFITITEGQLDALSVAQSFNCKYPVVSLPNGVSNAVNIITKNKKYLDGFKYVVLAFDSDKPGIDATNACMKLLEPGKVKIVRWVGAKDANDLLVQNKDAEIRNAVYNAVEYIPDPIMTGDELLHSLEGYSSETLAWPFKVGDIQPIRIPAVYTIAARAGVGKTEFVGEITRSVIGNGGKIGIIALEQTMQQVLLKQTDALLGTRLSEVRDRELTIEEREQCKIVAENIVIYNHITYGCDLLTIVENIPYMVKSLGCQLIIFDNITYSLGGTQGDERRSIDIAMTKLKDSTVKYNYSIFNICHIKRNNGFQVVDEEEPVNVDDIRGSQGIDLFSDYIIGLHRDKNNDNITLRNTLKAYILKDRFTGNDVGKQFTMKYDGKLKRLS